MSDIGEELDGLWKNLEMLPANNGAWRATRLRMEGSIACYAAIRNIDGRCCVVFESPIGDAPLERLRFEAEGVSVREQRDFNDCRYRVAANTEDESYQAVFRIIAIDLIKVVVGLSSVAISWERLKQRIEAWQACLRARRRGLTREEQVGLYGELLCLRSIAAHVGVATALEAWKGPLRGLYDFLLVDQAFEVKTATGNDHRITVSSLDQLEEGAVPLAILRPRLRAKRDGQSLADLVEALCTEIAEHSPTMNSHFEELLLRAGYLAADSADYFDRFELFSLHVYEIGEGFPTLRRSSIDPAILEAVYQLDEGRLAPFRRSADRLDALLGSGLR